MRSGRIQIEYELVTSASSSALLSEPLLHESEEQDRLSCQRQLSRTSHITELWSHSHACHWELKLEQLFEQVVPCSQLYPEPSRVSHDSWLSDLEATAGRRCAKQLTWPATQRNLAIRAVYRLPNQTSSLIGDPESSGGFISLLYMLHVGCREIFPTSLQLSLRSSLRSSPGLPETHRTRQLLQ